MDLKRNAVRRIVRNSIHYPDELGIVACSPNTISGHECAVGEIFKPFISMKDQRQEIREAVESLRQENRVLDYEARFVNENKCSLGPEIHSILQEMKSLSPREIAELVPRMSSKLDKLSDDEKERFTKDIEGILKEEDRKVIWVTLFNLFYIVILTAQLLYLVYSKRAEYDILVSPKALPGFKSYWGFAAVNILLGFSLFYFHYRYSFRITDLRTFQFASLFHITSLTFFYVYLRNQDSNYARLAFVSTLLGVLFQLSLVVNMEDVPGLDKLLPHYPDLFQRCATVQTTTVQQKTPTKNLTEILVSLFTNLIPAIYLTVQYYKIA